MSPMMMSEAAGPGQRTVGLTVYAPNRLGTLAFAVPQGDPLAMERTSRRSPHRLLHALALPGPWPTPGRTPVAAGLSELLWHHEDAKAYLSQNGEWRPVEIAIGFCRGKKKNADKRLADAETVTLDTAQDVEVYLLEVQRQRRSVSSTGRGQLTPAGPTGRA
jgi:hypothetical protein